MKQYKRNELTDFSRSCRECEHHLYCLDVEKNQAYDCKNFENGFFGEIENIGNEYFISDLEIY